MKSHSSIVTLHDYIKTYNLNPITEGCPLDWFNPKIAELVIELKNEGIAVFSTYNGDERTILFYQEDFVSSLIKTESQFIKWAETILSKYFANRFSLYNKWFSQPIALEKACLDVNDSPIAQLGTYNFVYEKLIVENFKLNLF